MTSAEVTEAIAFYVHEAREREQQQEEHREEMRVQREHEQAAHDARVHRGMGG